MYTELRANRSYKKYSARVYRALVSITYICVLTMLRTGMFLGTFPMHPSIRVYVYTPVLPYCIYCLCRLRWHVTYLHIIYSISSMHA